MSKFKPGDVVRSLVENRPYDGIVGIPAPTRNHITIPYETDHIATIIAWVIPGSSEWVVSPGPWSERDVDIELHPEPEKVTLSYMKWLTRNV